MELKYIVYVTVNLCNGKLYFGVHRTNPDVFDGYIGSSIYRQKSAIENTPFHKAVRKYGYENFRRTTIAIYPDTEEGKKQAYDLEATIVNSTLLKSKNVYNITTGGSGGNTEQQNRRVYQFTLDGNYLRSFKNSREAAISIDSKNLDNIKISIRNCCLGLSYSSHGYYWSYFKEFIQKEDYSYEVKRRYNKIAQYTVSGKFLRYYNNISEARAETGLVNINYAILNKASVGGYQWRWYKGDDSDISPFRSITTTYRNFPIIVINEIGLETVYESIKQCIEKNPLFSSKGIKAVLNGKNKTHKGFKFKWKDDDMV